jgi:hypothetical protein
VLERGRIRGLQDVHELPLGDHDAVAGVAEQVLDLLGR